MWSFENNDDDENDTEIVQVKDVTDFEESAQRIWAKNVSYFDEDIDSLASSDEEEEEEEIDEEEFIKRNLEKFNQ
jgi:hypothetical protein